MADIKQAMIWLKEGKKVRIRNWDERTYYYLGGKGMLFFHVAADADDGVRSDGVDWTEILSEDWEVQESQSLTGGGSPIHKVEGTLSAHEVGEAQQTAIPYCKKHQYFHKVFPKYKSCEGK